MVEKRPFPGDQGAPNGDTKRPKPSAPSIQDKLAEAKAKAAAIKARMAAQAAGGGSGTSTPTPTPPPAASGGATDRLAAMKARLAALKSGAGGGAAASSASAPHDERRPSEAPAPKYATTLGNRRTESPLPALTKGKSQSQSQKPQTKTEEEPANPYFDPKEVGTKRDRISRTLMFNRQGKYVEAASKLRRQEQLEKMKALLASRNRQAKLEENSERGFIVQAPPDIEWWDVSLLSTPKYNIRQLTPHRKEYSIGLTITSTIRQKSKSIPPTQS